MNAACAIALDQESCQLRLYGMIFVLAECHETYLPGLPKISLSNLSGVGKALSSPSKKTPRRLAAEFSRSLIRFAP
jgi:hypothetical protein